MQIISFHPENFKKIAEHISRQLPVILPTDTCYGFSGLITSAYCVSLVERMKGRENKPFLLLTKDNADMAKYGKIKNVQKIEKLQQTDCPTSFLLPKTDEVPSDYFPNFSEIAIRVPSSFLPLQSFLEYLQAPLFSTSANKTGSSPLYHQASVIQVFSEYSELLFATAGDLPYCPPSALVRIADDGTEEYLR